MKYRQPPEQRNREVDDRQRALSRLDDLHGEVYYVLDAMADHGHSHARRGPREVHRGRGNFAMRSFVTYTTGIGHNGRSHDHHRHKVPEGFVLNVDPKTGYRYIVSKKEIGGMDEKTYIENRRRLMMEHGQWPTVCGPKKHLTRFGAGVYLYFDFIRFTTITNFILAIILTINIAAHFYFDGWKSFDIPFNVTQYLNGSFGNVTQTIAGARNTLENIFVSSYSTRVYPFWFFTTIICVFAMFLFGPALAYHIKRHFTALGLHDHEDQWFTDDLDVIRHKDGKPKNKKRIPVHRIVVSYFVFLLVLLVSTFVTMGLNLAQAVNTNAATRNSTNTTTPVPSPTAANTTATPPTFEALATNNMTYIFTIGISIFLALSNFVWWKLCEALTTFETHYTWTQYRKHLVVKYYIFKVLNLSSVFLTRWLVSHYYNGIRQRLPVFNFIGLPESIVRINCSLIEDAEQFLILILLDLTVHRWVAILWPWMQYKLWACCCGQDKAGTKSDKGRPDFDVAVEYLELLYRQYLLYLGFPLFPPMVYITLFNNLIEYVLDKWVLLHLSRTPPHLGGSMRTFLVFFMFMTAFLAVAMFPIGIGWTLSRFTYSQCPGTIFA